MQYIHEDTNWPSLTCCLDELMPKVAELKLKQGLLTGRMSSVGFKKRALASLDTLATSIVKSSAIEGEHLNPEQVRSSLAKRLGVDIGGLTPVDRYVEGVVEMMLDATQNFNSPLTAERLFGWHAALFPTGRSGMHAITVGAWRTGVSGDMQIVSGPIGRERVHFQAPDASRLPEEMAQFLDWFNQVEGLDLFIKSAIAHFWFVTIHPFEDRNGRIGRAIADMCLAASDLLPERYYSMSSQIELERKAYYEKLELNSKGGLDITDWVNWFLDCLGRALDASNAKLDSVLLKAEIWDMLDDKPVNDRQAKIINRLFEPFEGKLTAQKYAKICKCSHDTALRDIKRLIEYGVLEKEEAGGRSVSYRLKLPEH